MRGRLLMLAPIMPSDGGGGLAMRAAFFLDAYCRRFDVDLVVAPVTGSGEPTPFVRSRVQRLEVLKLDRADSHYQLVASVRDPASRLEAFRRYGRPSLAAFNGAACPSLERFAHGSCYAAVHVFRLYLAELAALGRGASIGAVAGLASASKGYDLSLGDHDTAIKCIDRALDD